jgi:hypothetical protein
MATQVTTAPTASGCAHSPSVPWPRIAAKRCADDPAQAGAHRICTPEIAREITRRWISDVPSKIV